MDPAVPALGSLGSPHTQPFAGGKAAPSAPGVECVGGTAAPWAQTSRVHEWGCPCVRTGGVKDIRSRSHRVIKFALRYMGVWRTSVSR